MAKLVDSTSPENRRAQELLQIQYELSLALSATSSLKEAVQICLDTAIRSSGMDSGGVYLVDDKSGEIQLICHQGLSEEFIAATSHYSADSENARIIRENKFIYSEHQELGVNMDLIRKVEDLKALAVLPVSHKGEAIACLNVGSHTQSAISEYSRIVLESIAAQIGDAIARIKARIKMEKILKKRVAEIATLHAITVDIASPIDIDILLEKIVAQAADLLRSSGGGLYRCDHEKREARCVVSYKTPRDFTGTVLKYGEGAAGLVAETGEALIIDDYNQWEGRAKVYVEEQPFSAVLSAPIIWQGEIQGVIHILRDKSEVGFDQADLEFLKTIANHTAIALENARLLQQGQGHANELEKRVQERTRELEVLVKSMAGREVRMAELKTVIRKLRKQIEAANMTPIADDPLKGPIE
jgi:GAF domain-containing protein